jgi:hypothetical protein
MYILKKKHQIDLTLYYKILFTTQQTKARDQEKYLGSNIQKSYLDIDNLVCEIYPWKNEEICST